MEIGQKMTIECIESNKGCAYCVFSNDMDLFSHDGERSCRIKCMNHEREDKKTVIFVETKSCPFLDGYNQGNKRLQ